jgi:glycosyltransferase involved in cell wall biosynthesis
MKPKIYICQNDDKVFVDIIMLTYNHENYIEKAIESVLMQRTQYSYRIMIGEDCSTDSTRQIVKRYYKKYPDKFELYLWNQNVGVNINSLELVKNCKGKYIAQIEGDDYWTDPNKLEKQITFLENHKKYIGTAHNVRCVDIDGELLHCDFNFYPICEEHVYAKEQAVRYEMAAQTASLVYRNIWIDWSDQRLEQFIKCKGNGDLKVELLLGVTQGIYYFRDIMADHRRVFQGDSWTAQSYNKNMLWFQYESCCAIQTYIKEYEKISLNADDVFESLFDESFVRLFSKLNKENVIIYWKFLRRKMGILLNSLKKIY